MDLNEVITNEEDLKALQGRGAFLYRASNKIPYCGNIGVDEHNLPAIIFGKTVVSLRNLDILDLGPVDVVYLSKKGI